MSFQPQFIHRNLRWMLPWLKAAEDAGLPGSSIRVLVALIGHHGGGRLVLSRHGIERRAGIPRSTVRDGAKALLALGWIEESGRGALHLVLEAPPAAASRPSRGGRIPPPMKYLNEKPCPPIPPTATPPVAVPAPVELEPERKAIQAELVLAGCNVGGARTAARTTALGLEAVVQLLGDLGELVKAGKIRHLAGMAVWAVKRGKRAARPIERQARRLRGESVRLQAAAAPPPPDRWQGTPQELEEMAQDYRELLPPAALTRVQAGADRAGGGLATFCRLAA